MQHAASLANILSCNSLRRQFRMGLSVFVVALCVLGSCEADDHEDKSVPPQLVLLSPHDGSSLNGASLHVQALVAAFKPQRNSTFVFNGQTVAGRNSGKLSRVDVALDGVRIQSLDTRKYGRQIVADFQVALAGVAPGTHSITVTAFQGEDGEDAVAAAQSAAFTLDRTLVAAQINPIEEAATPQPFAAFAARSGDNETEQDAEGEQQNNEHGHSPARLSVSGKFVLGHLSDGIDLTKDRVVVALGSHVIVLEPGQLICIADEGERRCKFEDRTQPLLQSVILRQDDDGQWRFTLRGGTISADVHSLYLRIGNDWGGIDFLTNERLVSLRPALDTSHQIQAFVGANGGTVETIDATGVRISLQIPAGALTRDTLVKVTPLSASPLADSSQTLHPGVQFEPEGLQFAAAAKLAFDFSHTNINVHGQNTIYLLTSPTTMLPMLGSFDSANKTLTTSIHHFSTYDPSAPTSAFEDLKAWADPILNGVPGSTSFQALEALVALASDQMKLGCTKNCIDLGKVANTLGADIATLVAQACPLDIAHPTDQALSRWLELEALAQGFGVTVPDLRPCIKQILSTQIDRASIVAASPAANDPALSRLVSLIAKAQQLGFADLQTKALQKLDQALRDLAARLTATGHASDGTANESQAHQDAITSLKQEQLWVTTIEPTLATVDPNLAATLQKDIDGFSSKLMTVKIEPNSTYASASASDNCSQTGGTTGGSINRLTAESDPPVSLSASAGGAGGSGTASFTVSQPASNILVWDVGVGAASSGEVCTDPIGGRASASLSAVLTFQRPGTVKIDAPGTIGLTFSGNSGFVTTSGSYSITPGSYSLNALTSASALAIDGGPVIEHVGGGTLTITFTPQ